MFKNYEECPECGHILKDDNVNNEIKKMRLKHREVYLFGEIVDYIIQDIITEILYLDKLETKQITLYINSGGGTVGDGFALIDIMKNLNSPIRTVGLGEVCSMACAIFVAGTKGLREVGKNTWFMFHPITSGMREDYVKFQKSRVLQAEQLEKQYDQLILDSTKIPEQEYRKAKDTELWLPAKKVIEYEIADKYYDGK